MIVYICAASEIAAAIAHPQFRPLGLDARRMAWSELERQARSTPPDLVLLGDPLPLAVETARRLRDRSAPTARILMVVPADLETTGEALCAFDGRIRVGSALEDLRRLLLPWMSREDVGTRRRRRASTRIPIRVLSGGATCAAGVILDVHPGGVGVLLSRCVPRNEVQVVFRGADGEEVKQRAEVAWMEPGRPARGGLRLVGGDAASLSQRGSV